MTMKSTYPSSIGEMAVLASSSEKTARMRFDWHQSRSLLNIFTLFSSWFIVQLAYWLTPFDTNMVQGHLGSYVTGALYAILASLLAFIVNLDDLRRTHSRGALFVRCVAWCALTCMSLVMVVYGVFYAALGRWIVLGVFLMSVAASFPIRLLVKQLSESRKRRVLLVGGTEASLRMSNRLEYYTLPFEVVLLNPAALGAKQESAESIKELCLRMSYSEVILAHDIVLSRQDRNILVEDCVFAGVSVSTEVAFVERHLQLTPSEAVGMDWFEYLDLKMHHPLYHNIKRALDVLLATGILALGWTVLLPAMAWIRLVDGGPVIIRQKRIGQYGQPFEMLKLRTMRRERNGTKPTWTQVDDTRLLPLAGLLRRLRIDELPQLLNVLQGTMTLIGPRPELPELNQDVVEAIPQFRFRYCVKPGLTGWAQINAPYGASLSGARQKLEFDLFYIKNMSLMLDLQIILRTFGSWMQGAR